MFDFNKINPFRQKSSKPRVRRRPSNKALLTPDVFHQTIKEKVPSLAADYCTGLWEEYPFSFELLQLNISNQSLILDTYLLKIYRELFKVHLHVI